MKKAATLTEKEIVEIKDAECITDFALENLIKKSCISVGSVLLGEYKFREKLYSIEVEIYGLLRNRDDKEGQGQEIDTFFIYNGHRDSLEATPYMTDLPLFIKKHQIEADEYIARMEKENVANN